MKFQLIAAATLLAGSTIALAQDQDSDQEDQAAVASAAASQSEDEQAEEEDDGDEVVCRTERVTGSLTRRRRTCLTRNEWRDLEANTRNGLNQMGSNASGGVECRLDQFGGCQ